ncbi:MFS transporter [Pandoraea pulmonicola]|nr:MFS transporter [Pandoraea pulmonicola]AJC22889.1 hypothetical protein RO07_24940 [Pandoraea pulmonicola]
MRTLLGAGLGMFLNLGPVLVFSFGIFLRPIASHTGWSVAAIASTMAPALVITAALQPMSGVLLDRYGARRFALLSLAAFACGLALLGSTPWNETSFLCFLVLATCLGAGQTPLPYARLVAEQFDRRRGLALGIALSFSGVGIAIWPQIAKVLLDAFSWRGAYVGLGALTAIMGALAILTLPQTPLRDASATVQVTRPEQGEDLRGALRRPVFWILAVSFFTISAVITGSTIHAPAILIERGQTVDAATTMASIVGIASVVSRLLVGAALDGRSPFKVTFFVFLAPALGTLLLSRLENGTWLAALLIGVGLGAEADTLAYLTSRVFGMRHFGKIYGALMAAFLVGTSVGPAYFAYFLAGHGGYEAALMASAISGAIAAFLVLTLRQPDRHDTR